MTRRVLLLQHMDADGPGRFGDFLRADGFTIDSIMVHRGETLPSLAGYDFMYVLGGAMDVWQEDEHAWLVAEKAAIREWVKERARPFLGICLGHQLLAEALGGTVSLAGEQEIGVFDISLNAGTAHRMSHGLPKTARVTQWHHAEVASPPPGAFVFASSPVSKIQAMLVGGCALGLQFHAEWKNEFIASWAGLPAYVAAIEKVLGPDAHTRMMADAATIMPDYHRLARTLYDNLMSMAGLRTEA